MLLPVLHRIVASVFILFILCTGVSFAIQLPDCCPKEVNLKEVRLSEEKEFPQREGMSDGEWNIIIDEQTQNLANVLRTNTIEPCAASHQKISTALQSITDSLCLGKPVFNDIPPFETYDELDSEKTSAKLQIFLDGQRSRYVSNGLDDQGLITKEGMDVLRKSNVNPYLLRYADDSSAQKWSSLQEKTKAAFSDCIDSNSYYRCYKPCWDKISQGEGMSDCEKLCGWTTPSYRYDEYKECMSQKLAEFCELKEYLRYRKQVLDACRAAYGGNNPQWLLPYTSAEPKVVPKEPKKEKIKPEDRNLALHNALSTQWGEELSKRFKGLRDLLKANYDAALAESIKKNKPQWDQWVEAYHDADRGFLDQMSPTELAEMRIQLEFMERNRNHPDLKFNRDELLKVRAALGAILYQEMINEFERTLQGSNLFSKEEMEFFKAVKIKFGDSKYEANTNTVHLPDYYKGFQNSENLNFWRDNTDNGGETFKHEMSHAVLFLLMSQGRGYEEWEDSSFRRLRDYSSRINPWDDYSSMRDGMDKLGGTHSLNAVSENAEKAFDEGSSHFTAYALNTQSNRLNLYNQFKDKPTTQSTTTYQDPKLFEKNVAHVLIEIYKPENGVVAYPHMGDGPSMMRDYFSAVRVGLDDQQLTLKEFIRIRSALPGWNQEKWEKQETRLIEEHKI